jgi:hypothetical protein
MAISLMLKALGLAFAMAALVWLALRDQPHYAATLPWIAALCLHRNLPPADGFCARRGLAFHRPDDRGGTDGDARRRLAGRRRPKAA